MSVVSIYCNFDIDFVRSDKLFLQKKNAKHVHCYNFMGAILYY